MKTIPSAALALLLALPWTLHAAPPVAGAWQSFSNESSVDTWFVYSYIANDYFLADWAGTEVDNDTFMYSFYYGDGPIEFATDSTTSGDTIVGNHTTQNIRGIYYDAYFDPDELDILDVGIYANGPVGKRYYYSIVWFDTDFEDGENWYGMTFLYSDPWYYQLANGDWQSFIPNATFISSIEEIDLRFYPKPDIVTESNIGIDNFILLPTVEAPALQTSVAAGLFKLTFTPKPGTECSVEKLIEPGLTWQEVTGQTEITTSHVFQTPATAPRGIFRVNAVEHLTPMADP